MDRFRYGGSHIRGLPYDAERGGAGHGFTAKSFSEIQGILGLREARDSNSIADYPTRTIWLAWVAAERASAE